MAIDRDLDRGAQLTLLERLYQVAECSGGAHSLNSRIVGVRGEEYHRDIKLLADAIGGLDAIHVTFEPNIHEHQVRTKFTGLADRFFAAGDHRDYPIAEPGEAALDIKGDDAFVFGDEH